MNGLTRLVRFFGKLKRPLVNSVLVTTSKALVTTSVALVTSLSKDLQRSWKVFKGAPANSVLAKPL